MNPETKLQMEINDDLRKMGVKFFHPEKGRGKNKTHRGGWPDLSIFPGHDLVYFVELKTPTGVKSPKQVEFYLWAIENKYKYFVIRSIKEWILFKEVYLNGITDNIRKQ